MNPNNLDLAKPTDNEILYEGFAIPTFLKVIYSIFVLWGLYYLAQNMLPDLSHWMH
jgi:hypothetical protein